MTAPLRSFVVSLIVILYVALMSTASQLQGNIVQYDAELQGGMFTSAVLDQLTGALYVSAGASSVYRFTSSLRPEAQYTLNTQSLVCDDNRQTGCRLCPNGTDPADDFDDGNGTGIVRLDPESRQLVFCGGRCGQCSVLNATANFQSGQHLQVLDRTSSASYMASRDASAAPVMVFSAQNATDDGSNVTRSSRLFVAGATAFDREAVSVREMKPTVAGFDVAGARFFTETYADSYQFIDGLDAGDGFMYFVAVRRYERAPWFETRLVRLCRDDTGRLDSYAEVKLSCVLQTSLTASLNIAVTAHVAPVGAELARRFQLEAGEPAIYLVAERREQPIDEDGSDLWTSGICVYTLHQVRNKVIFIRRHLHRGCIYQRVTCIFRSETDLILFFFLFSCVSLLVGRVFQKA